MTTTARLPVRPLAVSPPEWPPATSMSGHDAIYRLLGEGRLRSVMMGRRRLIPVVELERFLAEELA